MKYSDIQKLRFICHRASLNTTLKRNDLKKSSLIIFRNTKLYKVQFSFVNNEISEHVEEMLTLHCRLNTDTILLATHFLIH